MTKRGKANEAKIADGDLIRRGIFDDLRAQIAAFDRSQILLVRFSVAGIFIEHVGVASLDLGFQDFEPEFLGFDRFSCSSFLFILGIKSFEFFPQHSSKPGASLGQNRDQSLVSSTRCMNRSGIQRAVKRSRARISSLPVFFLRSRNSKISACQGSR